MLQLRSKHHQKPWWRKAFPFASQNFATLAFTGTAEKPVKTAVEIPPL